MYLRVSGPRIPQNVLQISFRKHGFLCLMLLFIGCTKLSELDELFSQLEKYCNGGIFDFNYTMTFD